MTPQPHGPQRGSAAPGARPAEGDVIGQRPGGGDVVRYQSYTPLPETTGDVAAMSLWSGQGVGLVRAVMPAAQIVEEIHRDAGMIIHEAAGKLGD